MRHGRIGHRIRHYGLFAGTVRARQHRARPPIARRADDAPAFARRGRQRGRTTFASAPMPVLRRPDDHRRDLRRRAPCAIAIAEPDQDRHLMIDVAALPASQPPLAFASSRAPEQEGDALTRSPVLLQAAAPSPAARASSQPKTLAVSAPAANYPRHPPPPDATRARPRPQIPIGRARPNSAPSSPRFPPWEAFERRPHSPHHRPARGRRPKPSYEGRQVKRKVLVSVNSDYQTGCAPCQPRIRRDPAIPNHDPSIREKEFLAAGPIFTSAP